MSAAPTYSARVTDASDAVPGIGQSLRELLAYRDLLWNITLREIKVRYKQSILGVAWAILQPLSFMAVLTMISRMTRLPSDSVPYPIFVLTALVPWMFFASALSFAIPSLVANTVLVGKVYMPREIFPLSAVLAAAFDFCFASIAIAGLFVVYGLRPTVHILWVPPLLAVQVILTSGLALLFSALVGFYRDLKYALPLVIQLGMFVSPVIYPASAVPERWRLLYAMNPMAAILDGYRRATLIGTHPEVVPTLVATSVSLLVFWLGYRVFKIADERLADVI